MAYNYWDNAYESGHVPWDPGEYDGQLPYLMREYRLTPCNVLDIGCGNGKSLVWLAERGFTGTGIEIAPTALAQARRLADRRRVTCRWLLGHFPDDFDASRLPDGGFNLIMDRGWFHLHTGRREQKRIVHEIGRLLAPGGIWYSLLAAREKGAGFSGPPRWGEKEIRRAMSPELRIDRLELSVFTPGEPGSMASWICVSRRI